MLHFDPNLISIGHLIVEYEQFFAKFQNNVKHKNLLPLVACNSKSVFRTSDSFALDQVTIVNHLLESYALFKSIWFTVFFHTLDICIMGGIENIFSTPSPTHSPSHSPSPSSLYALDFDFRCINFHIQSYGTIQSKILFSKIVTILL